MKANSNGKSGMIIVASIVLIGATTGTALGLVLEGAAPTQGLSGLLIGVATVIGAVAGLRRATGYLETGFLALAPGTLGLVMVAGSPWATTTVAPLLLAPILAFVGLQAFLALGPGRGRPLLGLASFIGVWPGLLVGGGLARAGATVFEGGAVLIAIGILVGLFLLGPATRAVFLQLGPLLYRTRARGLEHLPTEGSALVVCNHVSFVDWWLIGLGARRPMRSIIDRSYYENPWFRWLLDAHGAIPVDASGSPAQLLRSLRDAGEALDDGDLVCIFAEGQIGRLGQVLPFQRGLERMLKGREVPVIPAHLEGLAGSRFAPRRGLEPTRPGGWRRCVDVAFAAPLASTSAAADIREAILELEHASWILRADDRGGLHRAFLGHARRAPWRTALREEGAGTNRLAAVVGAMALARRLRARYEGDEPLALLLPPGRAGALVSLAVSLAGRTLLPLNPTAGAAAIETAVRRGGARRLLTSPRLLEKLELELPESLRPLMIEELVAEIGVFDRLIGFLAPWLPVSLVERLAGANRGVRGRDRAALLFTSGSSGTPKGVPLTHAQIGANVDQVARVLPLDDNDRLLGSLPLFHAFGLMVQWLALSGGLRFVAQANPLDAAGLGRTVEREGVTLMVATPTFLGLYLRRCTPGQFGSLSLVVAGAERLPPELATAFADRFGVSPLEGYGATECGPVISVSSPSFRSRGVRQEGHRTGSVGRPLPGVLVRATDPDSEAALERGTSGHLLVKGPNVMNGYHQDPPRTAAAMTEGWYRTGDLGRVDDEGFLTIEDRLARFSKIGGEMVPHGRVEEELQRATGRLDRSFALTATADAKKGERLVLFHLLDDEGLDAALDGARAAGLPNLFLPRRDDCHYLDELPLLPSGKLDLASLKRRAATL